MTYDLIVIGGGVIGLEMAAYYAAVGSQVTVVEMLELPLRVNDARQIIFPHPTVSEIIREVLWEFDD